MEGTITYDHAPHPVRAEFADCHRRYWERLAGAGAWWSGAERVAIAAEARAAERCGLCVRRRAALSPHAVAGEHEAVSALPGAAVEAVHAVVAYPERLTRRWLEGVLAAGLSVEAYVELVGTVVAVLSIDRFCRGVGVDLHPLPEPRAGEPSRYRPASAAMDGEAWVPMVPAENAGTPEADLWPSGRVGNVIRALSLVPDEVRTLSDLSAVHYLPNHRVRDPSASQGALGRAQMELVAGRVSALHECFY